MGNQLLELRFNLSERIFFYPTGKDRRNGVLPSLAPVMTFFWTQRRTIKYKPSTSLTCQARVTLGATSKHT